MDSCNQTDPIILCGDCNALSWPWGSIYNNQRGEDLNNIIEDFDLIPLNDETPTFVAREGRNGSNLDLIFVSSALGQISSVEVTDDTFTSDHFLVVASTDSSPKMLKSSTKRFNVKKVEWVKFLDLEGNGLQTLTEELERSKDLEYIYSVFLNKIEEVLLESGAFFHQD